ncbi:MAG: ABC transporter substrate-binding protein [Acetobacteraceae bacterium]|nr:ABC transporter substrate-binding protein [Acetobacteraceae bacterium]
MLCAIAGPVPVVAAKLRWASDGDVNAMDPYSRNETFQLSFLSNIYEPLIRRDRDEKLEPALAVSWEQTGPTVWRFHLRPGVKWQDGTPFTARDVVFSADRIRRPGSVVQSVLATVKAVRQIDDLTIDFDTNIIDPIFPQEMTSWLIMSKLWAEKNGAAEPSNLTIGQENYAVRHAMGTGPFRLVSREPGRRTILEPNSGWWDRRRDNLDRVEFDVINNDATRVAALLSGDVDMVYSVPPQDLARIRRTPGLRVISGPELRTIFLGMDQRRDELLKADVLGRNPFKDIRIRESFALAIDEEAIAAKLMRGQAHPTWLLWGPGVNGYDSKLDRRPKPDPLRAKKLLAEAGYPNGFSLTLDCPNDRYVEDNEICMAIAAMLARIGVRIDLNLRTKAIFYNEVGPPKYQTSFYLLGWTPITYDAHNSLFNLAVTRNPPRGEVNYGGYSNPEIDRLTDEIATETDSTRRQQMINEAAIILQKDFAYIPLHQQFLSWAARDNIQLVQMPDDFFPLRLVRVLD